MKYVAVGKSIDLETRIDAPDLENYKQATFTLARDAKTLGEVQGVAQRGGVFKATWTGAGLEENERSCVVHYSVKSGSLEDHPNDPITVYDDTMELTVVGADDAPLDGVRLRLRPPEDADEDVAFAEQSIAAKGGGKIALKNLHPDLSDVRIDARYPYNVTGVTRTSWNKRTVKVARSALEVGFEFPDSGTATEGAPHRQYVNVASSGYDNQSFQNFTRPPEYGHDIELAFWIRNAAAGDKFYVKAELGQRNYPLKSGQTVTRDGAWVSQGNGVYLLTATVTDDEQDQNGDQKPVKVARFRLGAAGGDVVKFSVGRTSSCADESAWVQNWRRIFYVTDARGIPGPIAGRLTSELANLFMELVQYGTRPLTGAESVVQVNAGDVDNIEHGEGHNGALRFLRMGDSDAVVDQRLLGERRAMSGAFTALPTMAGLGLSRYNVLFLYMVDGVFSTYVSEVAFNTSQSDKDKELSTADLETARLAGLEDVAENVKLTAKYSDLYPRNRFWQNGADLCADAGSTRGTGVRTSVTCVPTVTTTAADDGKSITINVQQAGVGRWPNKLHALLEIASIRMVKGLSSGQAVFATDNATTAADRVAVILLHEIAHYLRHAVEGASAITGSGDYREGVEALDIQPADNDLYLKDTGFVGAHCVVDASGQRIEGGRDYLAVHRRGTYGACIMWGAITGRPDGDAANLHFCRRCIGYWKAQVLPVS